MLRPRLFSMVMLTTALASAAGCSSDATEAPNTAADTGDAGTANSDTLGDTSDLDARADAAPDAAPDAGPDADAEPVERPPLPDFAYYRQDLSCGGSTCIDGVAVNIIGELVEKTENGFPRSEDLEDHEILFLKDFVLTDQTYQKMLDGWSCGPDTHVDNVKWSLHGRLYVDGTYERAIHNISGCMAPDSDHADTTEVRELIDMLDEVRDDHFQ